MRLHAAAASLLLTAVLLFSLSARAGEASPDGMRAALLTKNLGDPQAPGNLKIALSLPPEFTGPDAVLNADAFRVHIYPEAVSERDGVAERYRAGGLYSWRDGSKIFLDVRSVPVQEDEGQATVRISYAPNGREIFVKTIPGQASYTKENIDLMLAVDVSLSMNINDPEKRRVAAARMFLDMARQGGGVGRVGLVTFNHRAELVTPLIPLNQGERLLSDLDNVGAEGLTNLDEPLAIGLDELRDSRRPVVILLTDGKNEGHEYENTHRKAIPAGVRIFAVGLSEQADHKLLREMAEDTGGIYFRAIDDKDLPEIYARLAAELGKRQLLRSEKLPAASGEMNYPIDSTVRRMVAYADGGARVRLTGPGGATIADSGDESGQSGVHMGSPKAGVWNFTWDNAKANDSAFSLFGDTRFFLDIFPPQLRGNRFAIGVTLAQGDKPLPNAEVWMEPVSGITADRIALYDDGQHDDGEAGDGVYGNVVDLLGDIPDSFGVVVRADGKAWKFGSFIRQANAAAVRSDEPPPPKMFLDGDVDFGVLFPGERGSAVYTIDLRSHKPHALDLNLGWEAAPDWPSMATRLDVRPGRRVVDLEMTVPATAIPGDYVGRLRLSDGRDLETETTARVRVGNVLFPNGSAVDFGVMPPGTFISRVLNVPYLADKAVGMHARVISGDSLEINDYTSILKAGQGVGSLEVVVSAAMDDDDGDYEGKVLLTAGPGRMELPIRWKVARLMAKPIDLAPVSGVPKPPQLGDDNAPLVGEPSLTESLWNPDEPAHANNALPSPWEKASDIFEGGQQPLPSSSRPSTIDFDPIPATTTVAAKEKSFWSAWWVYLLAALLLLLLLLLMAAYILYRLGKSAMARFLMASAVANALMLIIFIALLGTSLTDTPRVQPSIVVNLVENSDPPAVAQFSDAEKAMLDKVGANSSGSASGGGLEAEAASVNLDSAAASTSGGLMAEKNSNLPEGTEKGAQLAMTSEVEPMPLDSERSSNLTRRERMRERTREEAQPAHDLAEMSEPATPPQDQRKTDSNEQRREVDEASLAADATQPERAVWSEAEQPRNNAATLEEAVLAANQGQAMEKIRMERLVKRLEPRGRRSQHKETPEPTLESRVEIADAAMENIDMAEAQPSDGRKTVDSTRQVEESILATDMTPYSQAVWSENSAMPQADVAVQEAVLESQVDAGMKTISLDRPLARLEPRDRKQIQKDASVETPEPRVEINDPARDAVAAREAQTRSISAEQREVDEARVAVENSANSRRAVWSGTKASGQNTASAGGAAPASPTGGAMEKIGMERSAERLEPRGRKGGHGEMSGSLPESRVELGDLAADGFESGGGGGGSRGASGYGVGELRADVGEIGFGMTGGKPGAAASMGESGILYAKLEPASPGSGRGGAGGGASPLGERMASRGNGGNGTNGGRAGMQLPNRESNMPGSAGASGQDAPGGGGESSRNRDGSSGETGEQRFDNMTGGDGGGADDSPFRKGSGRAPALMAGNGASPNPFAGGGGGNDRTEFQPTTGSGNGNGNGLDGRRGDARRGNGTSVGDAPGGLASVPGAGDGGTSGLPGGEGAGQEGRGRGRGVDAGEGRYDGMAKVGGAGMAQKGAGLGGSGEGWANLADGAGGGGLELIPLRDDSSDWKRPERRQRRRVVSVAASSVDDNSLLIVLGDFSRTGDKASQNLFGALDERLGQGLAIEERVLAPTEQSLADCLLALATPDEVRDWSDQSVAKVAEYLRRGGHIWMDASRTEQAAAFMERLTKATGGVYDELPANHQLNDDEVVDALYIDDRLAAVVTYLDWRRDWRQGQPASRDRALRFLVRGINYFLSGDAETGISLEPQALKSNELLVQANREQMPDSVSGTVAKQGKVWDEFGPTTAAEWRMPGWSDSGRLSAISDGLGSRALKIDLAGASKGRAAAYRTLKPPQDFSGVESVTYDVYYDGEGEASVSMVFTVRDYDGWSDYETPLTEVRKGWNSVAVSMTGRNFRALSDDGDEEHVLPGAAQTGRAGFFIYRDAATPAVVLMRNIRLH